MLSAINTYVAVPDINTILFQNAIIELIKEIESLV